MPTPKIDILVNLLLQLQPDPATTTLPLNDADQPLDYSRLIGNKVIDHDNSIGQLISSLNNLYSTVTVLEGDVTNLYGAVDPVPDFAFYAIMGDYLLHSIEDITLAIGNQFVTLQTATGDSTGLIQAITYEDQLYAPSTLASQPSLSQPTDTMADLPGWETGPTVVSDTLKNMWLTINDMRLATSNYLTYRGVSSCTSVIVDYSVVVNVPNQSITLFFVGNSTIPQGFVDVNSIGASLTISDGSTTPNIFTTFVNVSQANNNTNGININLSGTNINLYTTLTLDLVYNLTNNDLTCGGHGPIVPKTVTSIATPCVAGNIVPTSTTSFTASYFLQIVNQVITYKIETFRDVACTILVSGSTQTTSNPTTNTINYSVSGLTAATTYYVKMSVSIGGNSYVNCPNIQPITTL